MNDKVNLAEKLALLDGPYQPGIVGYLNDYKLAVVKVQGEFVWHTHDETDDFFLVLSGRLTIQLRDRDIELGPGELFVVPRGVEHCPKADEAALVEERPAMIAALRRAFPGALGAWLTKQDDGSWLDIILWASHEEAEDAAHRINDVPEATAWFRHITDSQG